MYINLTIICIYDIQYLLIITSVLSCWWVLDIFIRVYTRICVFVYLCIWYDGKNSHDSVLCDWACRLELEHIRAERTRECHSVINIIMYHECDTKNMKWIYGSIIIIPLLLDFFALRLLAREPQKQCVSQITYSSPYQKFSLSTFPCPNTLRSSSPLIVSSGLLCRYLST